MLKHLSLLSLMALAAAPLMGQSAKEVADNLTLPPLPPGAKRLPLPEAPKGASVTFGGADYEQIIGANGAVSPVISDTRVLVHFKVTKDGETAESRDYEVIVKPKKEAAPNANPKPATIPGILQWRGGSGAWKPGQEIRVSGKDDKLVKLFIQDLSRLFPKAAVKRVAPTKPADIALEVCGPDGKKTGHPEGYTMAVRPDGVRICGDTPQGAYWGTRTLLQILTRAGEAPCGDAVDFPRYAVRGCMLDIARTPYSLQDLRDVVNMMAWFKMNDLHLVINNNYIFHGEYVDKGMDPFKESYSAFRLESKVKGKDGTPLTAQDVSYSKADFRAFIDYAKARGVNIVPEFDTPGHALSFTRVRPDLIYQGPMHHPKRRCEMLDAANPETIKFAAEVFDEFLLKDKKLGRPVFEGCVMHVGSDEFFGAAEDYRKYTNGVLSHVLSRGYTPRVWGSLSAKKGKTPVVSKGVQMNIWSKDWMLPRAAVEQGYRIINTFDRDLYLVPFANYYRMDRKLKDLYENWLPNKMWNEQLPAGHPQLLGATFAVWNDLSDLRHRGNCMFDIWDTIGSCMDVLCGKLWGEQQRAIDFRQHRDLAKALGYGPALAESGEDHWEHAGDIKLPAQMRHAAIRPPYHLTIEGLKLEKSTPGSEQILLSGPEGVLIGVMKDGSIGFRRSDSLEFAWDAKLPEGEEVKLELIATPGKTRLLLNGKEVEKMTLNTFRSLDENFAKRTRDIISTFILPGNTLGKSFQGSIRSIKAEKTK